MTSESSPRSVPRSLKPAEALPSVTRLSSSELLALQAFEVVVRLGSFRRAAEALHLSPSAVSHRIRKLERQIGEELFDRVHRSVELTQAGRDLARSTGSAFNELARAFKTNEAGLSRVRLRLAVVPTFGSTVLIPHITSFTTDNPNVEMMIESVSREIDLAQEPFDAMICAGESENNWPGMTAVHLLDISTTPVCTPQIATELGLSDPSNLENAPLIHVSSYPSAWPLWLKQSGLGEMNDAKAIWVDSFNTAMQAAERGAGVALGLDPLFLDREQAGAICRPLPISHSRGGYWLVYRPSDRKKAALNTFRRWLIGLTAEYP